MSWLSRSFGRLVKGVISLGMALAMFTGLGETHTVTFDFGDFYSGGTGCMQTVEVEDGQPVMPPEVWAEDWFVFVGWGSASDMYPSGGYALNELGNWWVDCEWQEKVCRCKEWWCSVGQFGGWEVPLDNITEDITVKAMYRPMTPEQDGISCTVYIDECRSQLSVYSCDLCVSWSIGGSCPASRAPNDMVLVIQRSSGGDSWEDCDWYSVSDMWMDGCTISMPSISSCAQYRAVLQSESLDIRQESNWLTYDPYIGPGWWSCNGEYSSTWAECECDQPVHIQYGPDPMTRICYSYTIEVNGPTGWYCSYGPYCYDPRGGGGPDSSFSVSFYEPGTYCFSVKVDGGVMGDASDSNMFILEVKRRWYSLYFDADPFGWVEGDAWQSVEEGCWACPPWVQSNDDRWAFEGWTDQYLTMDNPYAWWNAEGMSRNWEVKEWEVRGEATYYAVYRPVMPGVGDYTISCLIDDAASRVEMNGYVELVVRYMGCGMDAPMYPVLPESLWRVYTSYDEGETWLESSFDSMTDSCGEARFELTNMLSKKPILCKVELVTGDASFGYSYSVFSENIFTIEPPPPPTVGMWSRNGNPEGGMMEVRGGDPVRIEFTPDRMYPLPYDYVITRSNPNGETEDNVGSGCSPASCVVDWTPTEPGSYTFEVKSEFGNLGILTANVTCEYKVDFIPGDHCEGFGGGALEQLVSHGFGALAPELRATDGWVFEGWSEDPSVSDTIEWWNSVGKNREWKASLDDIRSDKTYYAVYRRLLPGVGDYTIDCRVDGGQSYGQDEQMGRMELTVSYVAKGADAPLQEGLPPETVWILYLSYDKGVTWDEHPCECLEEVGAVRVWFTYGLSKEPVFCKVELRVMEGDHFYSVTTENVFTIEPPPPPTVGTWRCNENSEGSMVEVMGGDPARIEFTPDGLYPLPYDYVIIRRNPNGESEGNVGCGCSPASCVVDWTPEEPGSYTFEVESEFGNLGILTVNVTCEYKVDFELGSHGVRVGGGELVQSVWFGHGALAPEVQAETGWTFEGWSEDPSVSDTIDWWNSVGKNREWKASLDDIRSDKTYYAVYRRLLPGVGDYAIDCAIDEKASSAQDGQVGLVVNCKAKGADAPGDDYFPSGATWVAYLSMDDGQSWMKSECELDDLGIGKVGIKFPYELSKTPILCKVELLIEDDGYRYSAASNVFTIQPPPPPASGRWYCDGNEIDGLWHVEINTPLRIEFVPSDDYPFPYTYNILSRDPNEDDETIIGQVDSTNNWGIVWTPTEMGTYMFRVNSEFGGLGRLAIEVIGPHTVTFEPGEHGTRIGGGALTQVVPYGCPAVEPQLRVDEGWIYTWSDDFDCIVSDKTIKAKWDRDLIPVAMIESIEPSEPKEKADITLKGCGKDGKVTGYRWTAQKLENGVPVGEKEEVCFAATGVIRRDAGNWRIEFSVQDKNGVWMEAAVRDIEVTALPSLADLQVLRSGIAFHDQNGLAVSHGEIGERLTLVANVSNIGKTASTVGAKAYLYDGDLQDLNIGNLSADNRHVIAVGEVGKVAVDEFVTVNIPWTVGKDNHGNDLGYREGVRAYTVIVVPRNLDQEISVENNMASVGFMVGLEDAEDLEVLTGEINEQYLRNLKRNVGFSVCGTAKYILGSKRYAAMGVETTLFIDGVVRGRDYTCSPTGAFSLYVSGGLSVGSHKLEVKLFDGSATVTLEKTIVVRGGEPNLIVRFVSVQPDRPVVGDEAMVVVRVTNNGETDTTNRFDVSLSANSNGDYKRLTPWTVGDVIKVGESLMLTNRFNTSTFKVEEYYFRVEVDSGCVIEESNESDNSDGHYWRFYSRFANPTPISIWSGLVDWDGKTNVLNAEIRNFGAEPYSGGTAKFYVDGEFIGTGKVDALDAWGGCQTVACPWNPTVSKNYCVRVEIEGKSLEEYLNLIDPRPDLVIHSSDISLDPVQPCLGDAIQFSVRVRNHGQGKATNVKVVFCIEDENGERVLDEQTLEKLDFNDAVSVVADKKLIAQLGAYVIKVSVSSNESDAWPSDNAATRSFGVGVPVAVIEPNITNCLVGTELTLDGTLSSWSKSWKWTLGSVPEGSKAMIMESASSKAFFTPDVPGDYLIHLVTFYDDQESQPVDMRIVAERRKLSLGEAVNATNLFWSTSGDAKWSGEWNDAAADGKHDARSGVIGDSQESVLCVQFSGKGKFSFDWRASTQTRLDVVRLEVDGGLVRELSGETDWRTVSLDLGFGDHVIRWIYRKGRKDSAGEDAVWVDNVCWNPDVKPSFSEALNFNSELEWTTGGDADWETLVTEYACEGGDLALSGAIGDLQTSWIQTSVSGAGILEFMWSVSCEDQYDWFEFSVDGEPVRFLTGEKDWAKVRYELGEGDHTLRWEYWKDEETDPEACGADCALLDCVKWTPAVAVPIPELEQVDIPTFYQWLKTYRPDDAVENPTLSDMVSLANQLATVKLASKGTTMLDEFVAGTNPDDESDQFTAKIVFEDGKPKVEWTPDLNGNPRLGERVYKVWGAKNLGDEWSEVPVGEELDYRFFKVTVELPRLP